MISIVNAYICKDGIEAAQAMQGKDPSAPRGAPPYSSGSDNKIPEPATPPVTVVDSALQVLLGAGARAGANASAVTVVPPIAAIGIRPFGVTSDQKIAPVTAAHGVGDAPPNVEMGNAPKQRVSLARPNAVDRLA